MPRIDPTVSKRAEEIYKLLPQGERGKFVSDAIIEKADREQGTLFTPEQEHKIRQWIREEIGRLKE